MMKRLLLYWKRRKYKAYERFDTDQFALMHELISKTGFKAEELRWSLK
ncbi:hypothetical protein J2TS6_48960 [Paenibacillus albilobatus]|uniref:Uncharacterized protein n=1 Tax=Paenibacillus albilobatus TaxID=2716884 RepID=A0A919XNR3_9BACL|nr:hypothetical protein J2TS6_48960 [Paenibacillus albilobatus]